MSDTIADERSIGSSARDLARRVAAEAYALTGNIKELPGFVDKNFLIESASGRHVLKIVPADADESYVRFQAALLEHLERASSRHAVAFELPRIIPSSDGMSVVEVKDTDGQIRMARLVSYVTGPTLSRVNPHSPELLKSLGSTLGAVDCMLADFDHPAATRFEMWDLAQAASHRGAIALLEEPGIRDIVGRRLDAFVAALDQSDGTLPQGVIHNDANDNNVIVSPHGTGERSVAGLIDFGDSVRTSRVFELAIGATYAMLDKRDPLSTACHIVSGYASALTLTEGELAILFHAICARLAVSTLVAAKSRRDRPQNDYLQVSDRPVRDLLLRFESVEPEWAKIRFRSAAGLEPCDRSVSVRNTLANLGEGVFPVFGESLDRDSIYVHDISVAGSPLMPSDISATEWTRQLKSERRSEAGPGQRIVGIGRYREYRLAYSSKQFEVETADGYQKRTLHLGVDLFADAGTPVFVPVDGTVHSLVDNGQDLDYGPTVILRHEVEGTEFFTLYGHLAPSVIDGRSPGDRVAAGDILATLGAEDENGGWPPHLHLQVMTRLLGTEGNFPGVALATEARSWLSVCPNPAPLLGFASSGTPPEDVRDLVTASEPDREAIREKRAIHIGSSLSIAYEEPLHIVRGRGSYLYSAKGRAYLDCVNNVCHVGHSHPRVVAAASRQMAILNTNTRYLYEGLANYAADLATTLPDPLSVVYLVCSGSEANDLALRLARAATGRRGVAVVDHSYHGNLSSLIDISPYKFDGPGGAGKPDHVAVVPMPDVYRGKHGGDVDAYVADAQRIIADLSDSPHGIAAFFAESILSCGGQVDLPAQYLGRVYRSVHAAGAVCVADEVQVGFGRVGSDFWGFQAHNVIPDIVTMGKPIGNGHPLAAVVTTRRIADAFANGMEYFNTFGGNPVSCAVGQEVLSVIGDERLQERALKTGDYLKSALERLQDAWPVVGDVRGRGLFLGIELVDSNETRAPAARQAKALVNRMKDKGVLLSTDGPDHNVIKLKPPLSFGIAEADLLLGHLRDVLAEDALQPTAAS